jgi:Ca2+-binding RTX toxin-like protein
MTCRSTLAVLVLLLLLPGTAWGARVNLEFAGRGYEPAPNDPSGSRVVAVYDIVFTAASGEANRLAVTEQADGVFRIEDSGAVLEAGSNCTADGAAVVCRAPPPAGHGVVGIEADLGDGDDQTITPIHGNVRGGPGNDTLAADQIIDGGPGADRMTGAGRGWLNYALRNQDVSVTFDGQANDGEPGEGDDVRGTFALIDGGDGNDMLESGGVPSLRGDHPSVNGRAGNDRLIGSAGADRLEGSQGDDVLEGGGGDDVLLGGGGADRGRGGAGTDTWDASAPDSPFGPWDVTIRPDDQPNDGRPGEGDDVGSDIENFRTGAGNDHITGTDQANVIQAGSGDDTIVALGGADRIMPGGDPCCSVGDRGEEGAKTIDAGTGEDVVAIAAGDDDTLRLRDGDPDIASCSPRALAAIDADPTDDLARCATLPRLSPGSLPLRLSSRGTTTLRARCPGFAGVPCRGKLKLYERGRTRVLATGSYSIRPGAKEAVRVRLTHLGRALLRRHRRVRFAATASPTGHSLPSSAAHARGVLLRAR